MIKISHRGNIWGRDIDKENHPHYIEAALNAGFDCEIDLWNIDGKWMLGHDKPQYHVNILWLDNQNLWLHCKNKEAMSYLVSSRMHNVFWHENDTMTLTSQRWLWTTHWDVLNLSTVIMCLDEALPPSHIRNKIYGVCSDYIGRLQ